MSKTIKVGVMPGQIKEYVVEEGTAVSDVLSMADLSAEGYEVKIDGQKVDPSSATVTATTNLILLARQVKGNAGGQVKIGVMPGQIKEYFFELGTTVASAIEQADLSAEGYEVKVDGVKVDAESTQINESTNLILLARQVKGNK